MAIDVFVLPCDGADVGETTPTSGLVATWLNKELLVESGVTVATSVIPPVRGIVGGGIDMVLLEGAIGPKDTDVKDLVAFCTTEVTSVLTVGDKVALVLVPNRSPARVFSVGLRAT